MRGSRRGNGEARWPAGEVQTEMQSLARDGDGTLKGLAVGDPPSCWADGRPWPGTIPSNRSRTRVMVVDDYPMNVELLAANLERLGYDVVGAGSGEEAIAAIADDPPDVVLMDILMPGR